MLDDNQYNIQVFIVLQNFTSCSQPHGDRRRKYRTTLAIGQVNQAIKNLMTETDKPNRKLHYRKAHVKHVAELHLLTNIVIRTVRTTMKQ
jgi:hypothetical protein